MGFSNATVAVCLVFSVIDEAHLLEMCSTAELGVEQLPVVASEI